MHCSKQNLLFEHFVGAHQERLPNNGSQCCYHFQRKPSYTIVTRCAVQTYFTRSASLFNVAAGLKWSRALRLTMRLSVIVPGGMG
jgi:hypothetical protein